jgi:DNA-binding NarL/FixJ family response regulator
LNNDNGTSKNVIRILVAEDHWIARIGIITALKMQRDMIIVGEAANGRQAVELFREHVPDVAVLDVRMPVVSGIDAAIAIRHDFPRARLIALSTYGGDEDIRRALEAGMRAYLTKDILQDELVTAIHAVYDGGSYLPPSIAAALVAQMPRPDLSAREIEVLELVVQGLLNKQIAHALNISEYTVKNHVKNILEKLGVEDRTQAATVSIQRGIIHL